MHPTCVFASRSPLIDSKMRRAETLSCRHSSHPIVHLYHLLYSLTAALVLSFSSYPHVHLPPHSSFLLRPYSLLRHNDNPQTPRLPHHTPRHTFQPQPTKSRLPHLNLRNLKHMFQANCPHSPFRRVSIRRATRRLFPRLPIMVVCRTRHVTRAFYF